MDAHSHLPSPGKIVKSYRVKKTSSPKWVWMASTRSA